MAGESGARQVVLEFIEARNAHDHVRAGRLLAEDLEWRVARSAGPPLRGRTAIEALVGGLSSRLFQPSTVRRDVRRVLGDSDVVVVEYTVTGTTLSGNPYANDYCWIYDVRDDVITRITSYSDTLSARTAFGADQLAAGLAEVRRR
ncbi:MAG TPA: nuclear transport factor 2 family protein [Amycolatopsis sp.]|nr:nuclear transport factor 2 family protein [Amycolatopsis sp.]